MDSTQQSQNGSLIRWVFDGDVPGEAEKAAPGHARR
jgi:hypothetical protein